MRGATSKVLLVRSLHAEGGPATARAGISEGSRFRTLRPGSRTPPGLGCAGLHPHRHQHVEGRRALPVLDEGGRARIGELEQSGVAIELAGDVEEVAGIE